MCKTTKNFTQSLFTLTIDTMRKVCYTIYNERRKPNNERRKNND